ncbi:NRDE family protein [Polaribacter uvawellassae]|uniref:NRDE family protein n=1 Tax=Polaribacter uvawellassae TaxID=3133495 RepID=UPI00321A3B87
MCTVTYLPIGDSDFILTSNRDEQPSRKTIAPKEYVEDGVKLTYPKDELAGGTWIGLSDKNRLVCLLNGGFEIHEREALYKMSRGIIVKAILKSDDFENYITTFDFIGIEPFTIVLLDWNTNLKAYELVWDGTQQHFSKLKKEPKIWSSSTLYTKAEKELRKKWFADWSKNQKKFTQEEILKFHHNSEIGTPENSPKMKRSYVETVSITSVKKSTDSIRLNYEKIT